MTARDPSDEVPTDEIAPVVMDPLRSICLALPETYEEPAWTGTRWRIRTRTFAHALLIDNAWPPAYSRAATTEGPAIALMFRCPPADADALRSAGRPWFPAPWRADEMGQLLDTNTDWPSVGQLVDTSYRFAAPRRLASMLPPARPHPPEDRYAAVPGSFGPRSRSPARPHPNQPPRQSVRLFPHPALYFSSLVGVAE